MSRDNPDVDQQHVSENVKAALAEDLGSGDLTAELIPVEAQATAHVIAREEAAICGRPWVDEVFRQLDNSISVEWLTEEGNIVSPGTRILSLQGPARPILSGERTALNFLQTLSATATRTQAFGAAVAHTGARILDTRKTLPGLRYAQKYAVRTGGGTNHRMGLYDGILIKENHIASAGSVGAAVLAAKSEHDGVPVEAEVETLEEALEALSAGADQLLLDNFNHVDLQAAVSMRDKSASEVTLEASGGITLESVRAIAETGVDFISVGSLTKDIQAIDLSMLFELSR
ncbi:MAG: carboxylating nicotinate-nucleotide diphosphorylase [Gammaproteobacteria bacterium]